MKQSSNMIFSLNESYDDDARIATAMDSNYHYAINAYITRDSDLSIVYIDFNIIEKPGYYCPDRSVYDFAEYIDFQFSHNRWVFQYKDERFSILRSRPNKLREGVPKYLKIPFVPRGIEPPSKDFPFFYYESNAYFGNIASYEDLKQAFEAQIGIGGSMDDLNDFLDKSCRHKNGSMEFGSRIEHSGETLRHFLNEKGYLEKFYNYLNT